MARRIAFLTPSEFDAATLSGGAWADGAPLANLQDMQPSRVARSADAEAASTSIVIDAGAAVDWDTLAARVDWPAETLIRLRVASSEAGLVAAPGYDSGRISPWPASGRPTVVGRSTWDVWKEFAAGGSFRWWRLDIDLAGTDPLFSADFAADLYYMADGSATTDVGRLMVGTRRTPERNRATEIERGYEPADVRLRTPFGHTMTEARPRPRAWSVPFDDASASDAELLEDLAAELGVAGDLYVCLDPEADADLHRKLMLATIATPGRVAQRAYRVFRARLDLSELL